MHPPERWLRWQLYEPVIYPVPTGVKYRFKKWQGLKGRKQALFNAEALVEDAIVVWVQGGVEDLGDEFHVW